MLWLKERLGLKNCKSHPHRVTGRAPEPGFYSAPPLLAHFGCPVCLVLIPRTLLVAWWPSLESRGELVLWLSIYHPHPVISFHDWHPVPMNLTLTAPSA